MKLWVKNTILAVILVMVVAVPLMFMGGNEFGGTDDAASDIVSEVNAGYETWFDSVWEPPSGEIESLLFCVQAAIGAGAVGFALGRVTSKKNADR
ncbi:MAG: energy-coupling factor ABC transporter substrate-binding protein [Clostridiales bacterium]|nr:energy-coupling factor ABC transporter substrate-binding protein [Clostridiales bacterium]